MPVSPSPPRQGLLDKLFPFLLERRERAYAADLAKWRTGCEQLQHTWRQDREEWHVNKEAALRAYQAQKSEFVEFQHQRNKAVAKFRLALDQHHPLALEIYFGAVLDVVAAHTKLFPTLHEVTIGPDSKTAVIDVVLPKREDVWNVNAYRVNPVGVALEPILLSQKEYEQLYDSSVKQAILRALTTLFRADGTQSFDGAVVNGWVSYLDHATGHDRTSCIISVSAEREQVLSLAVERLDASACIKSLKGIVAGPMADIVPVKPIMHLNREDKRFVESYDVLADLNSRTNLAEIGWEQFEHLVRELFSKMFSADGAEVKVTQATSDGGVDAVAFDPNPIRGGKFVIQAKRYSNVVPVSAVRDLYGTMIAEGASKGILVTTAHFGRDSRDFVKDKPVSLIDGSNLVYLLEQYGYNVTIDIKAAQEPRFQPPRQIAASVRHRDIGIPSFHDGKRQSSSGFDGVKAILNAMPANRANSSCRFHR